MPVIKHPSEQISYVIKSRHLPIFILRLLTNNLDLLNLQLGQLFKTQKFSSKSMFALDLQKIPPDSKIDFYLIKQALTASDLILIGIINGSEQQILAASNCGLHQLPNFTQNREQKNLKPVSCSKADIITTTIRSGQKVYAMNRDLICTTGVNSGAEIVADGNIHVYGKLSGRALAGIDGDRGVSIFCTNFDAELIAIAGFYSSGVDMQIPAATPVQIKLIDEKLRVQRLT